MNNQKLIIYEFDELYKILIEINNDVNLIIKKAFYKDKHLKSLKALDNKRLTA